MAEPDTASKAAQVAALPHLLVHLIGYLIRTMDRIHRPTLWAGLIPISGASASSCVTGIRSTLQFSECRPRRRAQVAECTSLPAPGGCALSDLPCIQISPMAVAWGEEMNMLNWAPCPGAKRLYQETSISYLWRQPYHVAWMHHSILLGPELGKIELVRTHVSDPQP